MRHYYLQSLLNWYRLKKSTKGYWKPWLNSYLWQWLRPYSKKSYQHVSQIYNLKDIANFRKNLYKLGHFNPIWFQRIFEPETKGVRAWEYGYLLEILKDRNLKNLNVLDAGTGNSLLPDYLASFGANVTSLDLEKPMEIRTFKKTNLNFIAGDMTKLPFSDKTFDIVISISAIEHVGSVDKAKKTFQELLRVKKSSGLLYLTTDVYLPNQLTDNWPLSPPNKINDAFPEADFKSIFSKHLNWPQFKQKLLLSNAYSNYRGRFFTTVAIVVPPKNRPKWIGF